VLANSRQAGSAATEAELKKLHKYQDITMRKNEICCKFDIGKKNENEKYSKIVFFNVNRIRSKHIL